MPIGPHFVCINTGSSPLIAHSFSSNGKCNLRYAYVFPFGSIIAAEL